MTPESAKKHCQIMMRGDSLDGGGLTYCKLYLTELLFTRFGLTKKEKREIVDGMDPCNSYEQCERAFRRFFKQHIVIDL